MSDVSITCMPVGDLQANCYLLGCPETKKAVVIDPGGDADSIQAALEEKGLDPAYLVNTHGHFDHIGANAELKKAYPDSRLCIHEADAPMLPAATKNFSILQGRSYCSPEADRLLTDGDVIECGTIRLEVVHTPGHTHGGVCLAMKCGDGICLFSGDTLFAGGVGRTDFPGGDWDALEKSIRERIYSYPADTVVLPGHGPESTVGHERDSNPFVSA